MKPSPKKIRLDMLLVERNLVSSREIGQRMIRAGEVRVKDQMIIKPATKVSPDVDIQLKQKPRFVSRGGDKLDAALSRFAIKPSDWVCADVGASTGGFTDCLLKSGAAKVYAIDVGYGQLAWPLRQDERVIVMERTNVRYIESLPELVRLITMDVSFISVRLLLPVVRQWLTSEGQALILIKPQFEAGKGQVGKGGVVRDPEIHRQVLETVLRFAVSEDYIVKGLIPSPLKGPSGNIEFLAWLTLEEPAADFDLDHLINIAMIEAHPEE